MNQDMKKIRVMIVEDSAVVTALLEYCIGRDPRLEVWATAASAEEALGMLERGSPDVIGPDVIAMDIHLPGMDGLEATRRLRAAPHTRHIPIVALSAMDRRLAETLAMEAGCESFVAKPCPPESLRAFLENMVAGRT